MITREKYNRALDVVEAYQEQLFIYHRNKTPIEDWRKLRECSTRLQNILIGTWNPIAIKYIEDITFKNFMRLRNAGRKSWYEFQELNQK